METCKGGLSNEQRARISLNFRAAKSRLSCKRYRHAQNHKSSESCHPQHVSSVKRSPLQELPRNIYPQHSGSTFESMKFGNGGSSSESSYSLVERGAFEVGTPTRSVVASSSSELIQSSNDAVFQKDGSDTSGLTASNLGSDDDFDECILNEIDALCDMNSATKSDRTGLKSSEGSNTDSNNELPMLQTENANFSADASFSRDHRLSVSLRSEDMPVEYSRYLRSLNERQREAACSDISIPLMIAAGPGSGKTSTMVGRVLVLINEGISPSNILAMTFTTAAASEMKERVGRITGKSIAKELMISTFHSFSLQLCRTHAEKLDRTQEFLIYGQSLQRKAVIEAVRLFESGIAKENCDTDAFSSPHHFKDRSKKWQKFVVQAKASGRNPEDCCKMGNDTGGEILKTYNGILKSCNALDYHDLISCSLKLLTDFPEVLMEYLGLWKAIVIDEFQDTSAMQYGLLKALASHNRVTVVGDEDQSIFSFNGADISGFDSFRKDFPNHKAIRLTKNYRSTKCIVEAASHLIQNNMERSQLKNVLTDDNSFGEKLTVKECHNEDAQCAFVVDKIMKSISDVPSMKCSFGNFAVLYRRQVSGRLFQTAFRDRRIPFNVHGVAFYRKKVVKSIIAMLKTTLPDCDDGPYRLAFKSLLPLDKEEKKKIVDHIDKISTIRHSPFISVAHEIFNAKISGIFKRCQLSQGKKVLLTLDMISKLVHREESVSSVITSVTNLLPQKYLLEQRAIIDDDGGKFLNEDHDLRSVLQYLLDDVADFFSKQLPRKINPDTSVREFGCSNLLKEFIIYLSERERENFVSRKRNNSDSVTLTTIHQSKGLEWDTVFIIKVNESEIPLLHEFNGTALESSSLEEERRLFYVAMTRARKKLFILHVLVDSNWQVLRASRFLKEIPQHLMETEVLISVNDQHASFPQKTNSKNHCRPLSEPQLPLQQVMQDKSGDNSVDEKSGEFTDAVDACYGNVFLRRFSAEDWAVISCMFHHWAKKQAFHDPKRLLDKVGFVIDERMRQKKNKNKDVLSKLKSSLKDEQAFNYAQQVIRWAQLPADKRIYLTKEKHEHFQKKRIENSMGNSEPTPKQIAYLQRLGCTAAPTSRLHASHLIEQYKAL